MLGHIVSFLAFLPLFLCVIGNEDDDDYLHNVIINKSEEDVISVLNQKRGDPSFTNFLEAKIANGYTPLVTAIKNDKVNIAKMLVEEGANVNAKDEFMETALHHTTRCRDEENVVLILVRMMLSKEADINAVDDSGFTPLITACKESKEYLAKEFIKNGADVHCEDNSHRSALHYASSMGLKSVVDVLLLKGVKVEKSGWVENPLQCAIRSGHDDIALTLLNAGARADVIDESSLSLLHYDTALRNVRLLEELILKGAPIDAKTSQGETPLFLAAMRGFKKAVQFLIDLKADINCCNVRGYSPLHVAIRRKQESICMILATKGADLELKPEDEDTALITAVKNKMENCAYALLESGADTNAKDKHSVTPMHWAVSVGMSDLLDPLLLRGCDPNVKNIYGKSPLDFAVAQIPKKKRDPVINSKTLRGSLAFNLIEAGVDVSAETSEWLLEYLLPEDFDKFDIPLDDFIMEFSNNHANLSKRRQQNVPFELLVKRYEKVKNFALYRLLKLRLLQRGKKCDGDLESSKAVIYGQLTRQITKKTYLEKLSSHLVSDSLNCAGGYYKWKMERAAWNFAVASRFLEAASFRAKEKKEKEGNHATRKLAKDLK